MTQAEARKALSKVKPLTPLRLTGGVNVESQVFNADVVRWVEVDGEPVFWVGFVDYALTPHFLLCHDLADSRSAITLQGIHGGEPFACTLALDSREVADEVEVELLMSALKAQAEGERIIGPADADEVEPRPEDDEASAEAEIYL